MGMSANAFVIESLRAGQVAGGKGGLASCLL